MVKREPGQQKTPNKFQRPKFNNNNNRNKFSNKQTFGILNRSKVIKKKRPTNNNSAVRIANNANGAIGNRGRNKQQQLNKFRLQRRRNNQALTNGEVRAKLANKNRGVATPKALFKRPQAVLNRFD